MAEMKGYEEDINTELHVYIAYHIFNVGKAVAR